MSFKITTPYNFINFINSKNNSIFYKYDIKKNPTLLILHKVPRITKLQQSLFSNFFFPNIDVKFFDIPALMTKEQVENIIDTYVKETGNIEIVLNLNSQQMTDYGLKIVKERPSLIFINMISTLSSIRGLLPNLYFTTESDDFFLPVLWERCMGNIFSIRTLIIQSEEDVFVNNVALSANKYNISVIKEDSIPEYQTQIEKSTTIFICAITEKSQNMITSLIQNYKGNIVFIDSGPLSLEILKNINNARIVFTQSQSTSLEHLSSNHPWNLTLKSDLSNSCSPNILGLFSVILNSGNWKRKLIESKIIYNTSFGVNSMSNQVNTIPS